MSSSEVEQLLQPVSASALRAETIRLQCFSSDSSQLHEHFNDFITQPLCLLAACGSACVGFNFVVTSGSCTLDATVVVPPDFPARPSIAVVNAVTVGNKGSLSEVRRHVEAEVNHALLADLSHSCSGHLPPSTLALQVVIRCMRFWFCINALNLFQFYVQLHRSCPTLDTSANRFVFWRAALRLSATVIPKQQRQASSISPSINVTF
jgi:hypothetical protein